MKLNARNLHRDLAYFYLGLIIAFSFSGIILNHRENWYPMDYTYEMVEIEKSIEDPASVDAELLQSWAQDWAKEYDGHRLRGENLRVYFKDNAILDLNLETGKGQLEEKRKVPLLGHTMFLHKSTNQFWIWYSDIFGIAMLIIAVTGVLIPMGKKGFKSRGWKLALLGMIVPLLFLILFA